MAWFLVWPGWAWRGIRYYLGRHGMIYGMAWCAYGMDLPTWNGIWYGLAGIRYGLAGNGMVYGMTWRAWHCTWYGLTGMACYIFWPSRHDMVCGMAWRD